MFTVGKPMRVHYVVPGGGDCYFFLRHPTTAEFMRYTNSRVLTQPNGRTEMNVVAAAEALIDDILVDAEGLFYEDGGEDKPLNKSVADWKAKVPAHFKLDLAGMLSSNRTEITAEAKKV
jgi:hypothetical protein